MKIISLPLKLHFVRIKSCANPSDFENIFIKFLLALIFMKMDVQIVILIANFLKNSKKLVWKPATSPTLVKIKNETSVSTCPRVLYHLPQSWGNWHTLVNHEKNGLKLTKEKFRYRTGRHFEAKTCTFQLEKAAI